MNELPQQPSGGDFSDAGDNRQAPAERQNLTQNIENAARDRKNADQRHDQDGGVSTDGRAQSIDKGTDKHGRKEGQGTADQANLPERERHERAAITTLPDRLGFSFDDGNTTIDRIQKVLGNLSAGDREALKNPATTLYLVGTASRVGTPAYNQAKSQERVDSAKTIMEANREALQINAKIEVIAEGETKAREEGRPDGRDDRDDRAVQFVIEGHPLEGDSQDVPSRADIEAGLKLLTDLVKQVGPADDQNAKQIGDMVVDAAKDGGKEALKKLIKTANPEAAAITGAVEGGKSLGKAFAKWLGNNLAADIADKPILGNVEANTLTGLMNGLEDLTGVSRWHNQNPLFSDKSMYYALGQDKAQEIWATLSPADRNNVTNIMHSRDRSSFEQKLRENVANLYGRRGGVQSPRR